MMKHLGIIPALLVFFLVLPAKAEHKITEYKNVEWAKPKGFSLTADIYVPNIAGASKKTIRCW